MRDELDEDLRDGRMRSEVDFVLAERGALIRGRAVDRTGGPIAGALRYYQDGSGTHTGTIRIAAASVAAEA